MRPGDANFRLVCFVGLAGIARNFFLTDALENADQALEFTYGSARFGAVGAGGRDLFFGTHACLWKDTSIRVGRDWEGGSVKWFGLWWLAGLE